MSSETFSCLKIRQTAIVPQKAHISDAGFDLFVDYPDENCIILKPRQFCLFPTGISVAIPKGWYGRVAPRSGLSLKGIDVLAGVIDNGYRSEVKVVLINHGTKDIEIPQHSKIAQLVLEKCGQWEIKEVETLDKTERGEAGFGSTGF